MKTKNTYHFIDSWSGSVRRFTSLREAKKEATKEEAIYKNGNVIVGYGNKPENIVK